MATDDARPAYDDLAAIVREIAADDNPQWSDDGSLMCRYCQEGLDFRGKHDPSCVWVRARALAARLPPG